MSTTGLVCLTFENFAGFSALFSTRPKSEEVKKTQKITCLSTAADQPQCSIETLLESLRIQQRSLVTNGNLKQPWGNKYPWEV